MTTNYARGAAFERAIVQHFRDHGFFAVRSAGSHSPVDVVAWDADSLYLIQAKTGKVHPGTIRAAKAELEQMLVPQSMSVHREVWVKSSVRGEDWIRYEV